VQELKEAGRRLARRQKALRYLRRRRALFASEKELAAFCGKHSIPMSETQAGKSALPADDPLSLGAIRRHRHGGGQQACGEADVILARSARGLPIS